VSEELKETLRLFRRPPVREVNLKPTSPFEALLDQRLEQLEAQLKEVRSRVSGLLWAILGAVVIQVVMGLMK